VRVARTRDAGSGRSRDLTGADRRKSGRSRFARVCGAPKIERKDPRRAEIRVPLAIEGPRNRPRDIAIRTGIQILNRRSQRQRRSEECFASPPLPLWPPVHANFFPATGRSGPESPGSNTGTGHSLDEVFQARAALRPPCMRSKIVRRVRTFWNRGDSLPARGRGEAAAEIGARLKSGPGALRTRVMPDWSGHRASSRG
jgi:hypothetical protein